MYSVTVTYLETTKDKLQFTDPVRHQWLVNRGSEAFFYHGVTWFFCVLLLLDLNRASLLHQQVDDAAVSLCSVRAVYENPTERSKLIFHVRPSGMKQGGEGWNRLRAVGVDAQYLPLRINKEWKALNAASVLVGGLWEVIWLWAWRQIPCWSNRWPSASWDLQYVHKYLIQF